MNGLATYNGLHPFEFMSGSDKTTKKKKKKKINKKKVNKKKVDKEPRVRKKPTKAHPYPNLFEDEYEEYYNNPDYPDFFYDSEWEYY